MSLSKKHLHVRVELYVISGETATHHAIDSADLEGPVLDSN